MLSISACSSAPIEPEVSPDDVQALEIIEAQIAEKVLELKRSALIIEALQLEVAILEERKELYDDRAIIIRSEIRDAQGYIRQIFRDSMEQEFQRIHKEAQDAPLFVQPLPYEDRILHHDGLG